MWLVAFAVLCTAVSQIVQVYAARQLPAQAGLVRTLTQPLVWLAFALLGVGLVFWLIALTELEVSRTYPLFALGFVSTLLFARFGFGEAVSARSWCGAGLIVLGGLLCNW